MRNNSAQCLGFVLMSISQVLYPSSYIYISEHNLSMSEVTLIRAIVLMIICVVIAKTKGVNLQKSIRVHFFQFLLRNLSVVMYIYAIVTCHYYLSISVIHTIDSSGPIFVFMWDYYLYNITINRKQLFGIIIGLTGILITVNAASIYLIFDQGFSSGSTFENYRSTDLAEILFFAFFLIIANFVWAYSTVMVKTVKMKDSSEMNFHLALLLFFFAAINYCLVEVETKSWDIYLGIVVFSALPAGIGQVLFVVSLTLTRNTGVLTLFISISIIVGYSFSLLRYHQNLNPIALFGSMLIISGLAIVVLLKDSQKGETQKSDSQDC